MYLIIFIHILASNLNYLLHCISPNYRDLITMSGKDQPSKEQLEKNIEAFKEVKRPEQKEELYVHEVYNQIASHFSQTRYKPWPYVKTFLDSLPEYSLGVDAGCGNGKYLNVNPSLYIVGSDYSTGLVSAAKKLHENETDNDLLIADSLNLPHPNNTFDFALSIAVIHHFSTKSRRQDAIKELLRVLKPGGKGLIYCWALEQKNSRRGYHEGMDQDVLVPWVLMRKGKKGEKNVQQEKQHETKYRYYHLYSKGELPTDCKEAGAKVVASGYERDNWWTIIEKQ